MVFGKIDYLNLLPFHVFLKGYPLPNSVKKGIEFKKGVPSKLCADLKNRRVDAAVISSIESRRSRYKKLNMGIVARDRVISVLARRNTEFRRDPASMTSNVLCLVLGLNGEVVIGDNALKAYLRDGREAFYDMGEIWHEKTNLPFVFGRFCYTRNGEIYARLVNKFLSKKVKIPRYILKNYSKSRGISEKDILWYLQFISYRMDKKAQNALKLYIRKARKLNFSPKEKKCQKSSLI